MKFIMLINVKMPTIATFVGIATIYCVLTFKSMINTTSVGKQKKKILISHHFRFYDQLKFHAQLS